MNIYLPRKDGTKKKLGAIPLRPSNSEDMQIAKWLDADEGNLQKLLAKIQIDFRAVGQNDGADLDLD